MTDSAARGQQVFLSSACVYCHTVQGTPARGDVGPDLTHLASQHARRGRDREHARQPGRLDRDPQTIKPGALMPALTMDGTELQALVAYLESLR